VLTINFYELKFLGLLKYWPNPSKNLQTCYKFQKKKIQRKINIGIFEQYATYKNHFLLLFIFFDFLIFFVRLYLEKNYFFFLKKLLKQA
jgi:hypothetical protein